MLAQNHLYLARTCPPQRTGQRVFSRYHSGLRGAGCTASTGPRQLYRI